MAITPVGYALAAIIKIAKIHFPPALRTTGFTVARKNNGATTAGAMGRQTSVLDGVRNQPPMLPAPDAPAPNSPAP